MAVERIITVAGLKRLLQDFSNEITDDFQVWLSSDEEGNEFMPMYKDPGKSFAVDPEQKRIILFPVHVMMEDL